MESVWSVSKLPTESVGSRRELVANCVHTAEADATPLDSGSALASAVCNGYDTPSSPSTQRPQTYDEWRHSLSFWSVLSSRSQAETIYKDKNVK